MANVRVNLFCKKTNQGYYTIYLEIFDGNRKRKTTGLKVSQDYFSPLKNQNGKLLRGRWGDKKYLKPKGADVKTLELAERLRAKRENDLVLSDNDLPNPNQGKGDFLQFFEKICREKSNPSYNGALANLKRYTQRPLSFNEITYNFLKGFQDYLKTILAGRTVNAYLLRLSITWNEAEKQELTRGKNPFVRLKKLKEEDTEIKFLTIEQLQKLINCDIKINATVKAAFLLACNTGLRYSDIKKLTWDEVYPDYIKFRQKKSKKKLLKVFLNESAKAIIRSQPFRSPTATVFKGLYGSSGVNKNLLRWAKNSGLNIHLTFHWSRHTFATVLISQGVDLYVVSKLLGHSSIQQTQIYAQVLDEKKQAAVNKMPKIGLKKLMKA